MKCLSSIVIYKNRRNYGDSSVILNTLVLLTENPATLVVGGSENYILLSINNLTSLRRFFASKPSRRKRELDLFVSVGV